jgi:GT2 family glycosyltransferase
VLQTESTEDFTPAPGARIQVQSVLYNNEPRAIERAFDSLARAADLAISDDIVGSVVWRIGDASPIRTFSDEQLAALQARDPNSVWIDYQWFGENTGSARGHNVLADGATADYLLIQNPDVIHSPRTLHELLDGFHHSPVGMVEAKQLPIEHPKEYDRHTGETGWATTACALIPRKLFEQLDGFDSESFFLYCDDVDFSWKVRLAGYRVIFQPSACVFHDKKLSTAGAWQPSSAEIYYSAEAALFLAHKWSRDDIVDSVLAMFQGSEDSTYTKAAASFVSARDEGRLVARLDPSNRIAVFDDGLYTKHRYPL